MPPPSPPFLFLLLLLSTVAASHSCNSHHSTPCPPFPSPPPYPFSTSPGCGHPSFPLKCSSPHSILSLPNSSSSFSVLAFRPNSSSLSLSPLLLSSSSNCSALPPSPIHFSDSPFRLSDSTCSRLSALRSCSPPNLPNCSLCPSDCSLIKSPLRLLPSCSSSPLRHPSQQGCQSDVLDYLLHFLQIGFDVEYDSDGGGGDEYFSSCKACQSENGVCGFNSSDREKKFVCFRSVTRISPWIRDDDTNRIAILCSIFTVLCLLLVVLVVAAVFRSRHLKAAMVAEEDPTTTFLHRHRSASLLPPVFTYEELEASTNRFDPKRKIGDGGFGSVYLGQLFDGRIVAVKYLHKQHTATAFSAKSFCNEILILSSIDHPNLVRLHGYCSDPRGLLLVYDYVPNGTLADHLHGKSAAMSWQVRLEIALQTALALEYLHCAVKPAIVHRDITSNNIFVERDMRIKVGDFGLSRLLVFSETTNSSATMTSSSAGFVWTGPQGTPGYLDPDYHRSFRLTEKSDVYSFGVVLLELISGMRAVDQSREKREMALADLAVSRIQMGLLDQMVDPVLKREEGAMEGVAAVAELAFQCVAADKDDRPHAKEVVEELKRIRNRIRVGAVRGSGVSNPGDDEAGARG